VPSPALSNKKNDAGRARLQYKRNSEFVRNAVCVIFIMLFFSHIFLQRLVLLPGAALMNNGFMGYDRASIIRFCFEI
jgi:hypothetical protein